ncbi:MAG: ABC transporter permease [Actinomycetales bacterium]
MRRAAGTVAGWVTRWEGVLALFAVVLIVVSSATTTGFSSSFNISTSIAAMNEKALMVLPLTLLIIAREIDISVASIAGLSGSVMGLALQASLPLPVAIGAALVTGLACGLVNGVLVALVGLPSLIVTLGSLALFRGLCYVLLGSTPVTELPASLITFATSTVGDSFVPWAIVPFLVLLPVFVVLLHGTSTGRRIYAVGGSPTVADYAGVRTRRLRLALFAATGIVSAIAGIVIAGRTSQVSPDAALGFELDAITVVFLGGVSVLGGRGRFDGVIVGLILVITVRSVLQLHNVSGYAQGVAVGILLVASLLLNNLVTSVSRSRRSRHRPGGPSPARTSPPGAGLSAAVEV